MTVNNTELSAPEALADFLTEYRRDNVTSVSCANYFDAAAERLRSLSAENKISRGFLERIAKQPLLDELPEEAEGGDPEGGYDGIVSDARETLARLSGSPEPKGGRG